MAGKPSNPQAFPKRSWQHPVNGEIDWGNDGMTLRDYFAVHVAQGYLASFAIDGMSIPSACGVASYAYEVADAMLAEREKEVL